MRQLIDTVVYAQNKQAVWFSTHKCVCFMCKMYDFVSCDVIAVKLCLLVCTCESYFLSSSVLKCSSNVVTS